MNKKKQDIEISKDNSKETTSIKNVHSDKKQINDIKVLLNKINILVRQLSLFSNFIVASQLFKSTEQFERKRSVYKFFLSTYKNLFLRYLYYKDLYFRKKTFVIFNKYIKDKNNLNK